MRQQPNKPYGNPERSEPGMTIEFFQPAFNFGNVLDDFLFVYFRINLRCA